MYKTSSIFKTLAIISLLVAFTTSCLESKPEEINIISAEEADQLLDTSDIQVIDVRTEKAFLEKHLANAVNIPLESDNLEELISKISKDKPVLLYCNRGGMSAQCAQILKDKGFTKIYDLDGGLSKWEASGRTVVVKTKV